MPSPANPPVTSTNGYRAGIAHPQLRQRPRRTSQETTGTLSRWRTGVPQDGQCEPGWVIDSPRGRRLISTLANDPTLNPIARPTTRIRTVDPVLTRQSLQSGRSRLPITCATTSDFAYHLTDGGEQALTVELTTALLCDHASVREGLLFVVGGGITRIRRPQYPAHLGIGLAAMLEFDSLEAQRDHRFQLIVVGEDGDEAARVEADIRVGATDAVKPGENVQVPLAVDMYQTVLPVGGAFELRLYLDGEHRRTLQFWAETSPPV